MGRPSSSPLRANVVANLGGTAWVAVLQFACVPIYIKLLGVEAYGLVGFYVTLLTALRVLDLGLAPTMNREMARYSVQPDRAGEMRDFVRTFEAAYWLIGIAVGAAVLALAAYLANHWLRVDTLPIEDAQLAIAIMGGVIAAQWPLSLYTGGLMGLQRQVLLNAVKIGSATFSVGGAILVLWLVSPTIEAFFLWQMLAAIVQVAIMAIVFWRCLPGGDRMPRIDMSHLRRVRQFVAGMTGIGIFGVILSQMDKIVLSRLLPLEAFSYYTVAGLLASSLQLAVAPVYGAMFPRLSSAVASSSEEAISHLYHLGSQVMTLLIAPLAALVVLFAPEIVRLWTGDAALADRVAPVAMLLTVGAALNAFMFMPYTLQLAYGWTSIGLWIAGAMCVVLLPALYLMAIWYGALGAAAVWVAVNAVYMMVGVPLTHRRLLKGEGWGWLLRDALLPALAALAIVMLARELLDMPDSRVAAAGILAVLLLVAVLAAALGSSQIRPRALLWARKRLNV